MTFEKLKWGISAVVLGMFLAASGHAQQTHKAAARPAAKAAAPAFQAGLEPRAIEILKAASARLAAARSMSFTAVVSYESPSRLGPPLIYSTKSEVTMQRPDKLKVITLGDGPPSEFYYDGKTMMAFAPKEKLVAIADAPPTIDAALQAAYVQASIYFPFTDVIVADPYKDIADGLKLAFYIGQSMVVDNTTTDMVAYITGDVFVQAWIGAEDKLPRRIYAVYLNDRARLRHVLALSNWKLDVPVPADAFVSPLAADATRIAFARPDATNVPAMKPPPRIRAEKTQ
ncbi:DUF2092 domain-containing protein [Paraburkholderia sp. Cpub6]|uniref:DUF2092 domain-containing protein n=1 Tax=Paraburkholderia sp. Cpub6 TaxID=2723094 RepID=UPI0016081890|nr:DUF2092 domain-containing protein [Paraburkholderia sp. Cpub6]MBB5460284.1 hypothetical protein [Paraburkholderia sp. Cpub6]